MKATMYTESSSPLPAVEVLLFSLEIMRESSMEKNPCSSKKKSSKETCASERSLAESMQQNFHGCCGYTILRAADLRSVILSGGDQQVIICLSILLLPDENKLTTKEANEEGNT